MMEPHPYHCKALNDDNLSPKNCQSPALDCTKKCIKSTKSGKEEKAARGEGSTRCTEEQESLLLHGVVCLLDKTVTQDPQDSSSKTQYLMVRNLDVAPQIPQHERHLPEPTLCDDDKKVESIDSRPDIVIAALPLEPAHAETKRNVCTRIPIVACNVKCKGPGKMCIGNTQQFFKNHM
jgi:hypothetical protein